MWFTCKQYFYIWVVMLCINLVSLTTCYYTDDYRNFGFVLFFTIMSAVFTVIFYVLKKRNDKVIRKD